MCFIRKDNGDIIHDSNAVTKEAKLFDENLYASRKEEIVKLDIRNHINIQSLSQEQSNNFEKQTNKQTHKQDQHNPPEEKKAAFFPRCLPTA